MASIEMSDVPLRIFYVEGNANLGEVIELSLTKLGGFVTQGFVDTETALAGVHQSCPDAILVDAAHVDGGASSFLKQLRARPEFRGVPVILASDRKRIHQIRRYKAIGATVVIPTPINPFCLPQVIRDACDAAAPSCAAPDPSTAKDARSIGVVEHAGLAR